MSNDLATSDRIDAVQRFCAQFPPAHMPVTHRFTPGMYSREIFMPAGTLVVSKIHKTEHPFAVLSGVAVVWDARHGLQKLTAGTVGITHPGTRRLLYIREDCRWITFHATPLLDVDDIEAEIIEPHAVGPDGNAVDDEIMKLLKGETV